MARSVSSQLRYTEFRPHLKSQIFGLKSWIHFKKTVYTEHCAANAFFKFVMGKRYWLISEVTSRINA